MEGVPSEVRDLISQYQVLELIDANKKVKCSLTSHEMPCKAEVIKAHVSGKKFERLLSLHTFDYEKYKPHLVPSEKKWFKERKQLFCKLTLRHLNRDPHHVLRHVNGKRFQRALARWEQCQRTGEPFHPRGGSRKKKQEKGGSGGPDADKDSDNSMTSDRRWQQLDELWKANNEGEDADDNDSLTDLYPVEDFKYEDSEDEPRREISGSDSEFEDEEEIPAAVKQKSGLKRKAREVIKEEGKSRKGRKVSTENTGQRSKKKKKQVKKQVGRS